MTYAFHSIEHWLAGRPDARVSMDTFLYYQQGNPSAVVSPDLYVVFGSDKALQNSYRVWQEGGRLPSFVLEVTSHFTRRADFPPTFSPKSNGIPRRGQRSRSGKNKYLIYEQVLGVAEYFLFDPTSDYLEPRVQGFRLEFGRYVPIEAQSEPLPNLPPEQQPARWLYSEQLELAFAYEGPNLRCYDPVCGTLLLRAGEALQALEVQTERAEAAVRLADSATQRAEVATQRAEAEAHARAEAEQAKAEALAEAAQLRAELEAFRGKPSA